METDSERTRKGKNVRTDNFSSRLGFYLDQSSLSRAEIAGLCGVGTSAIAKWLNGHLVPKSEQLYLLSAALGVSMEMLLTGQEPLPPKTDARRDHVLAVARERMTNLAVAGYEQRINQHLDSIHAKLILYTGGGLSSRQSLRDEAKTLIDDYCNWVDQFGPWPEPLSPSEEKISPDMVAGNK